MSLPFAEFVSSVANWVLVGALVLGLLATYAIVISGNVKEAAMKRELAASAERIETLRNDNLKLEAALAPRTLTKEQFDALQELRGKIRAVNVGTETDAETYWFATQVAIALQKAGIEVRLYTRGADAHSSGNMLYDEHAFANPDGLPTGGEPLASVLTKAGIWNGVLTAVMPLDLGAPENIPMIIIGGRFVVAPRLPYLGPRPSTDVAPAK